MRKIKLFLACLLMAVLSIGQMWGTEAVYKQTIFLSDNQPNNSSYTGTFTNTTNGFAVTVGNANNNNNGWSSGHIKVGRKNNASTAYIQTNAAIDKAITKVTLTIAAINANNVTSIKLYTSSNGSSWTEVSSFTKATGAQDAEIESTNQAANLYYKIELACPSLSNNGSGAELSKVEFYAEEGGGGDVIVKTLESIAVEGMTTSYEVGDAFSFDGTCTATYSVTKNDDPQDAEEKTVTPTSVTSPDMTTTGNKTITVSYTEDDVTKTTTYDITVSAALPKITIDGSATGITTTDGEQDVTAGDFSFGGTFKQYSTTALWFTKGTGFIYNKESFGKIRKITINYKSGGSADAYQWIKLGNAVMDEYEADATNGTEFTTSTGGSSNTFVVTDDYEYFCISISNKNLQASSIVISYEPVAVPVKKPVFNLATGTYLGTQSVEITCETEDADIYYTLDGNDPTSGSTPYTSAIAISETKTLKAIAIKGSDESPIATATYTIINTEHAGTAEDPYSVADAKAVIDGIGTKEAYVTGKISQVDSYDDYYKSITYWISADGTTTNQLKVYSGKGIGGADFSEVDDVAVKATVVVKGTLMKYDETYEFNYNNELVSYKAPAEPIVTLSQSSLNLEAEGNGTQEITLTATNFENEVNEITCAFYNTAACDGDAISQPAWITNLTDNNSNQVSFDVADNAGEARQVWLKVTASDGTNSAFAVLAISQAKYTVDYATLPFAFNGGRADIATTNGITQEGLDSDYGSFPKLKFNTTGDVVTIKINEDPGKLTYDIKNNSFNGGTFTVQESADGETYTNVAIHTEITGTQSEKVDLKQATRYVKFIYTSKSEGNVGLGNITISEYVAPTECEAPSFTPEDGETFTETLDVVLASATDGATIYYTLDESEPTTNSSIFDEKITISETTTIKAIAVKEGLTTSSVASATFTKVLVIDSYEIDFEADDLAPYVNWEFSNIAIRGTIIAHGGSNYASNASSSEATTGTASCTITTKAKYANPGTLTFYISKESNNTTASSWVAQVSEDGTDWTDIEPSFDAKSMNKGDWDKCEADLSAYTNVYVRIAYSGSTAIRAIDDISLEPAAPVKKPVISDEESFLTSAEVSITCGTTGATIYYTTDGSDPKSGSVYSSSFTLTETATVRAIAKLDDDWSAEAESKTFTKIIPYTTIAGLAEDMTNTATPVYITLGNWQVSVVKNSQAFVTDGENGLIIYQNNHGLKEGDVLSGTIQCNLVNYNDVVELTGVKKGETSGLTVTDGTINPIVKTIAEANALTVLNTGLLVKLENVTYNEGEFKDEDNNTIAPYTTFYNYSSDLEDGKKYNITGIIQKYQSASQIYPRKQADIQEVADASAPETPTFSPEGGVYTEAQSVSITCATEGATIYYTTDGSAPDNTKTLYKGAINVEATTIIKAIAIKDDKSSVVASATFTINIPEDESVSKTWDLSIASYDANPTENQVKWSATYVNMVVDKYNATTNANNYLGGDANNRTSSRFYQNSKLTITPNGKEITSVVFTATSTGYANALQGSEWTNASASVDGTTVTVTPTDGKNAIIAVVGGTCGFTAVQVNYKNIAPEPPTADYTRDGLTVGNYATICLPNGGTISGATLFDLDYYDGANTLYLLEVNGNAMVAGRPYVFLPSGTSIEVFYTDDANEPAGSYRGLVGSYSEHPITADDGNYILYQNAYYLVNSQARVGANRAYIHMDAVPTAPQMQQGAPRRRVAMSVHGTNTATGIDALNASDAPVKVLINGQLFIIRGEKMFDVKGQLVK